ncbi:MAG: serine protease [Acidobacteria bacterium]|nr:serine protease [Acidobacteriota bacterium]
MPLVPLRRAARVGLLCAITITSTASARAEADPVLERVKHGVVLILTHDGRGRPLLRGSGFFVAGGRVVTSLHVLRGASGAQVLTHDGKTHRVESVAGTSASRDLALLEIAAHAGSYAALEVERESTRAGVEIAVVGGASEAGRRVTRGAAGGVWYLGGAGELIQITARIAGGDSGGPVVNRAGRVVGVATLYAESSDDLNFAVTGDAILDLISQSAPHAAHDTGPSHYAGRR